MPVSQSGLIGSFFNNTSSVSSSGIVCSVGGSCNVTDLVLNGRAIINAGVVVGDLVASPPSGSDLPVVIGGLTYGWGRWSGANNSVTSAAGTVSGLPGLFSYTNANAIFAAPPGTAGSVSYSFVGGPKVLDSAGNTGSITSMSGTVDFTSRNVTLNSVLTFTGGGNAAAFTVSGAGSVASSGTLVGAPLSWTCTGAGCGAAASTPGGTFNARFFGANFSQAMIVNGTLLSAYLAARNPVIFLGVLKCPTC